MLSAYPISSTPISADYSVLPSGISVSAAVDRSDVVSAAYGGQSPAFSTTISNSITASVITSSTSAVSVDRSVAVSAGTSRGVTGGVSVSRGMDVSSTFTPHYYSASVTRNTGVEGSFEAGRFIQASLERSVAVAASVVIAPYYGPVVTLERIVSADYRTGSATSAALSLSRMVDASVRIGGISAASVLVVRQVSADTNILCSFAGSVVSERWVNASYSSAAVTTYTADSYSVWLVNARTGGHFQYDNGMRFNSVCSFKGDVYFTNSSGLWKLSGNIDDTAAIVAELTTGGVDLGAKGYVFDGRIQARGGEVALSSLVDEDSQAEFVVLYDDSREGAQSRRVKGPKGLHGRMWQFKLGNVDGSVCEIESLSVTPQVTRRSY
jgi:hypothetical protein